VAHAIAAAKAAGEELLVEGSATLVLSHNSNSAIVQQETFGPVAVIQIAKDFNQALELANGVKQGLVMTICTSDEQLKQKFATQAQVGILNFDANPLPVNAAAPFGGWKNSGLGPAEHGTFDAQFYTRPQASYNG
jgi:acyl-CoA reductase-like NAD-dependent aldehyde dehydrogenase